MKVYRIVQPLELHFTIELSAKVKTKDGKRDAIRLFKEKTEDHTTLISIVEDKMSEMASRFSSSKEPILARATVEAAKNMKDEDILVIHIDEDD